MELVKTNRIVNADRVDIQGIELQADVQIATSVKLDVNFARLVGHVVDSNEPLRDRPGRRGGVQLSWAMRLDATLTWRAVYVALSCDSSVPMGNLHARRKRLRVTRPGSVRRR